MNYNYLDFLDALKEKRADNFLARSKSEVKVTTEIDQIIRDDSWLEKLEECIPYLDVIIRNPRRFIVQEEDVIPVEKTKKITHETVKHLAKHTSNIEDIDDDGFVKPSKLLNVFKEETIDLYENRFIYSLLINLKVFLSEIAKIDDGTLKSRYERIVDYKAQTKLPKENVSVSVSLNENFLPDEDEAEKNKIDKARLENIVNILNNFMVTPFIRSLKGATPVRSPIRKTNVILKDRNFQKALELWEFLEKYDINESIKKVSSKKVEDPANMLDKYSLTYYLDYYSVANMSAKETEKTKNKEKYMVPYLRKVIEAYISETETSEKAFKTMVNNEFKRAHKKQLETYKQIRLDYRKSITNHKYRVKNALTYLD